MSNVTGLCRLGLYRESEKQFRSALNHQEVVDTYLYLAKVGKHYRFDAYWKIDIKAYKYVQKPKIQE